MNAAIPTATAPTTVAGRDFADATDRLKASLQRAPGIETAMQAVGAAAEVVNVSGALTRDVSLAHRNIGNCTGAKRALWYEPDGASWR